MPYGRQRGCRRSRWRCHRHHRGAGAMRRSRLKRNLRSEVSFVDHLCLGNPAPAAYGLITLGSPHSCQWTAPRFQPTIPTEKSAACRNGAFHGPSLYCGGKPTGAGMRQGTFPQSRLRSSTSSVVCGGFGWCDLSHARTAARVSRRTSWLPAALSSRTTHRPPDLTRLKVHRSGDRTR